MSCCPSGRPLMCVHTMTNSGRPLVPHFLHPDSRRYRFHWIVICLDVEWLSHLPILRVWRSRVWGSRSSRATDFGSGIVRSGGLECGGLESEGLEALGQLISDLDWHTLGSRVSGSRASRATDFGSGIVHSGGLESGVLESGGLESGGLEALGQPISDLESYTLKV